MTETIETIARVLRQGPPLRLAVLFGSVAKGTSHAKSDIDIAIWPLDEALALGAELDLTAALARELRRDVDLVRLDRASTLVRWQVAKDGVLVLAEPRYEWSRFRAQAASEHADAGVSLRHAAELFRRRILRGPG